MAFKSNLIFDVLSNILTSKNLNTYNNHINDVCWATVSKFLILRYLSMSANPQVRQITLDNYITLERMPETILYKWCLMNIPKQNNSFIRYIK